MCFIHNDCELFVAHICNTFNDERKFLNGSNDDSFTILQSRFQIRRFVGRSNNVFNFRKFFDVVSQLLVQQSSVGHYNYGVKQRLVGIFTSGNSFTFWISLYQLISQPRNRIGFPRTSTVLNEIGFASSFLSGVFYESSYDIQLMVSWEKQSLLTQRIILCTIKPYEMLNDIGNAFSSQNILPKIGSLMSKRIWWIAFPKIITKIERQEKCIRSIQFGSHIDFISIDCKMHNTSSKVEQGLRNIALEFILIHAVYFSILSCPMVFQFNGRNRNSIDENHHINFFQRIGNRIF